VRECVEAAEKSFEGIDKIYQPSSMKRIVVAAVRSVGEK